MVKLMIVPVREMRYRTLGDWQITPANPEIELPELIHVFVANLGDDRFNFLVAIHELIEAFLCKQAGITQQVVDAWDLTHLESDDPGSAKDCPYMYQHHVATKVELLVMCAANISLVEYESKIKEVFGE
jgi:hypothetical protein